MFFIVNDSFIYGCISLFRCNKGMCVGEASQHFAVAKAEIGISDGICNVFLRYSIVFGVFFEKPA